MILPTHTISADLPSSRLCSHHTVSLSELIDPSSLPLTSPYDVSLQHVFHTPIHSSRGLHSLSSTHPSVFFDHHPISAADTYFWYPSRVIVYSTPPSFRMSLSVVCVVNNLSSLRLSTPSL